MAKQDVVNKLIFSLPMHPYLPVQEIKEIIQALKNQQT